MLTRRDLRQLVVASLAEFCIQFEFFGCCQNTVDSTQNVYGLRYVCNGYKRGRQERLCEFIDEHFRPLRMRCDVLELCWFSRTYTLSLKL